MPPEPDPGNSGATATYNYSGQISDGYYLDNLVTIGRYLMAHGYNAEAAAGVAGAIAGESSGDPESQQAGGTGQGLIQWTPGSKARPNYPIITGSAGKDFHAQLQDIINYNNQQGRSALESLNKQTSPTAAADYYSRAFERPQVEYSDVRPQAASYVYDKLKHLPVSGDLGGPAGKAPGAPGGSSGSGSASLGTWFHAAWAGLFAGEQENVNLQGQVEGQGISDTAQAIAGLALPFIKIAEGLDWFYHPSHWIRIFAGIFGIGATGLGVYSMTHIGHGGQVGGSVAGVPVGINTPSSNLPMAIGLTGIGVFLLFVAFHNLPDSVDSFGGFTGYLAGQIRNPSGNSGG